MFILNFRKMKKKSFETKFLTGRKYFEINLLYEVVEWRKIFVFSHTLL